MSTAILIPARMGSQRFPGKPLEFMHGRTILHHCYQHACDSARASTVAVVTDSKEVVEHCRDLDMHCVYDAINKYPTGSDRCAGALQWHPDFENHDFDTVVNLQCDEPEISGDDLDSLITTSVATGQAVTASCELQALGRESPNTVKVVTRNGHYAAYFSRSPLQASSAHVGVYVYPLHVLQSFASTPQPKIELAEGLEQLRLIYMGIGMLVVSIEGQRRSINCPEDIARW